METTVASTGKGVTTTTTRRPPNPVSTPPPAADARAERARSALEMIDGVSNGNRDPIALYQREKEESERLRDQLRKEKERNAAQLAETEKVKQLGAEKTNHQIDKFLDSLKQGGFGPEHVDFLRSRLAVTPETPIEQLNNDDMRYAELVTASNNFFATRTKEEVNAIKDRMEAERRALQLKVAEKEAMLEFAKGELQEIYGEGNGGGPMRGVDQRRLERRMDPLRKPGARFQTPAATNTAPPATQPATANALPGGTPAAGTTDPNAAAAATATPATANPFQEQLQNFNNLTPDQVRELGGQLWNRNFSSAAAAAPNAQPNAAPANNGMIPNTMIPAPVPEGYGGNWGNMPQHTAGFVSVNASAAHHAQQLNYPPGAVKAIGMGKRMTNIYNKYAGALGASVVDEIMTSFNPNSTIHTKRNPYHLKGFNGTSDRPVLESALMPARQFD